MGIFSQSGKHGGIENSRRYGPCGVDFHIPDSGLEYRRFAVCVPYLRPRAPDYLVILDQDYTEIGDVGKQKT